MRHNQRFNVACAGPFPTKACPTRGTSCRSVTLAATPTCGITDECRTGFSREDVMCHNQRFDVACTGPFPAEACPTRGTACRSVTLAATPACGLTDECGTGFSRESVMRHAAHWMSPTLAPSRLKSVPLGHRMWPVTLAATPTCGTAADRRTGFSREGVMRHAATMMKLTAVAIPSSSLARLRRHML
jgi:hypothetical protein